MIKKANIAILTLFLAVLFIVAACQIEQKKLSRGEVRFVTNDNCVVKVDQVQFKEDGLVVWVTNTGKYEVDLDAHGWQPYSYFVPQTLQKLDKSGEWVKIPFSEDACVDSDCLLLAPGETVSMTTSHWAENFAVPIQPGTYRLTSIFSIWNQSGDAHTNDAIVLEFGW